MFMALAMLSVAGYAQITGAVYGKEPSGKLVSLPSANVYWSTRDQGVTTDPKGQFSIQQPPPGVALVFSYVGYKSDTIHEFSSGKLEIILEETAELAAVNIEGLASSTHIDRLNPLLSQQIGSGELQRAACCNLSESFETNASVDVNYTDAVSGSKQIQLLGLNGVYSQLLIENIPFMRGLGSAFGLEYIPGTWMQSISVSKGNSAVINGYESITGQINAEFKKPEAKEKYFFNYYLNDAGRHEFNINAAADLSKKVSTIVLGHYSFNNTEIDHNKDGFMDMNLSRQINLANFWQYISPKGLEMRWGVRVLDESRNGGQISNSPHVTLSPEGLWKSAINNRRGEAFVKTGYIFKNKPGASVGFINSFSVHQLDMLFGHNDYSGQQRSFYSNLIYHAPFKDSKHMYDAGFNFMYDDVDESLNDSSWTTNEMVPGVFFQYTYTFPEKITFMAGIREDYNSRFGWLTTPRVHVKYHLTEKTSLRASAGLGYRSPYVIPENISLLTSARKLVFLNEPELEQALNLGISLVQYVNVFGKEMMISAEYFKTSFQHQMLIDMESDTSAMYVFSLNGKSYSHNAQVEISYPAFKHLEVRAALRYNDVRQSLRNGELLWKPLVSNYKGLVTMAFSSNMKRWQADLTAQFVGKSRLPDRSLFPLPYQLAEFSPAHTIIHLQFARNFKNWSIYAGAENLTNFVQHHPIISAENPYSPYFDSGVIWGPVMGRKIYAGVKIRINKKD